LQKKNTQAINGWLDLDEEQKKQMHAENSIAKNCVCFYFFVFVELFFVFVI